jgi:UPF0755 protein
MTRKKLFTSASNSKPETLRIKMNTVRWIKIIAVICVAVTSLLCLIFCNYANSPIDFKYREFTVEIPHGSTFSATADMLERAGLIRHKREFYLLALLMDAPEHIKPGEYDLSSSMTPVAVLDKLVQGKVKGYFVFIPEGYTLRQIASRLENEGLADRESFVSLASDSSLLSALGIKGKSAEGYLFPDTYRFDKSMGEEGIIRFMVKQFRKGITPEILERADKLHLTLDEVVTLASIIEKEGGPQEERPLVSAVFHNRLKRGMRLQSDPTVIYGIVDFDGNLRRSDLRKKTPYNTYRIKGLPPGPICNPGMEAIKAALYPAPVDFLYFVSKNNGSHQFSSNLKDHNAAVLTYQIKRRK